MSGGHLSEGSLLISAPPVLFFYSSSNAAGYRVYNGIHYCRKLAFRTGEGDPLVSSGVLIALVLTEFYKDSYRDG